MKRTYRFLLLFYPRGHRDQFAEEMTNVLEEAFAESRAGGGAWYIRFAMGEIFGLIAGAAAAWLAPKSAPEMRAGHSSYLPQELIEAQRRVDANIAGMVQAIANHQFERARVFSNLERQAREHLRRLREKYSDS